MKKQFPCARSSAMLHTHTHTPHRRWLLATFVAMMLLPMNGKSQSTCNSAMVQNSDTAVQYSVNDSVFWLKISARLQNMEIFVIDTNTSQPTNIDSLFLYGGNCDNLTLIKKSTDGYLFSNSLTPGENYFLKLKRSLISQSVFSILINDLDSTQYNYSWTDSTDCPPTPIGCESIPNNEFSIYTGGAWNTFSPYNAIYIGRVCGWHALRATPGIEWVSNTRAYLAAKEAMWASLKNVQPNTEYFLDILYKNGTMPGYTGNEKIYYYLTNRDLMPYTLNHQLLLSHTYYPLPFTNDYQIGVFDQFMSSTPISYKNDFRTITIPTSLINNNLKLYIFADTTVRTYIERSSLKPLVRDTLHTCLDANGSTTLTINNFANQTIIWDDPNYNSHMRIITAPGEYWAIVKHNDSCTVKKHLFIVSEANIEILSSYCKPYMNFDCQLDGCNNVDHVDWNFGDGTSYTTSQGQTFTTHQYSTGGSYNVSATLYYTNTNSSIIASITQTATVHSDESGNTLGISGNPNTCDSITSYSSINSFPNANCTWTITPSNAGTIIAYNNHTVTINWHEYNMNEGQSAILSLNDGLCSQSIKIWKCCKDSSGTATVLNDETITSNINNGTYYLNGTITIDGNVTISNVVFNMAPEAKIELNAPSTFNVNLSTIKAGCNYMWDGIYNRNSNSTVNTQSSTIQDAQNAIYSENGGFVSVSNTLFNLNNFGIRVYNSAVTNPLNVSNCRFYCTTDGTGATPRNLIAPLTSDRGTAGIDINNVLAIQVGDVNKATKNKFSYTYLGININNSNANIYNNNFLNLPIIHEITGIGVKIIQTNGTDRTVNIGGYNSGNNIYTNLFSNCDKGIFQKYQTTINVLCDTFVNCTVNATEILSNTYGKITFTKNRIQNSVNGLLINDFMNTRLVVDSNSIYNVTNGITTQNATSQECYGATIRKNTITGTFKTGIKLLNVKGRSLIPIGYPGYERQIPYIYANTITFGNYDIVGTNYYTGIGVTSGDNTYIEDNIVNTPTYTVANEAQGLKLNGIVVSSSPRTTLCSNSITNLGMGIKFSGLCTASPIKSNSINNNFYGVRLEGATIGNQGVVAVRWVNRNWWNTPFVAGRYRVQGSVATATTWTHGEPFSNNYSLITTTPEFLVSGGFTSTYVSNPVPQTCAGYDGVIWIPYTGGGGGGGDAIINQAQSDELATMPLFTADVEENQYYQASAFYANAQSDNLSMSVSENAELIDNSIQTTSIPQFDQVNKLISANRIDEAIAVNDAIAPKNLIEKNHKIANGIYLQSWAKGRFELTEDERSTLLQIATQPHIQGGYGVITAWVMLNRIYHAETVKTKNNVKPIGFKNSETTIYPNPAREQVTVNGASEILYVLIYDIQGRELLKFNNESGLPVLTINTSKLKKGIYIIKLVRSDLSDDKVDKLIIE